MYLRHTASGDLVEILDTLPEHLGLYYQKLNGLLR